MWRLGNNQSFFDTTDTVGEIKKLEYFDTQFSTSLDSVKGLNYTSSSDYKCAFSACDTTNITIMFDENGIVGGEKGAVLILLGKLPLALRNFCLAETAEIRSVV